MEKFIVSARKYRPNNFNSLIGQESISVTLKNAILKDQLAHAYLFCGPRGVGKTSSARIFAKTINCLTPKEDMEPCGECESCRSFAEGRSYCIHELDAASNNSVDDIRLLTEKVRIPPQIGKYSVYIIDEVHMLSPAAFNAFLKTLEEPPEHAIFILATTEKHKILPTILSRCQTYDFNRISVEDIVKNLQSIAKQEQVEIDSSSLHIIATKADGAMRDALTLFDQAVAFCGSKIEYAQIIKNLNILDYEYYFNIIDASLQVNYQQSFILFDEILTKGFNALYFIGGLANHVRNLLVARDTATLKMLEVAPPIIERYKTQSAKCSIKFLYEALGAITKCEADYRVSNNQRLLVEFLLMRLAMANEKVEQQIAPVQATAQQQVATPQQSSPAQVTTQQPNTAPQQVVEQQQAHHQQQTTTKEQVAPQQQVVKEQTSTQAQKEDLSAEASSKKSKPTAPKKESLSIKNIIKSAQQAPATVSRRITQVESVNEVITPDNLAKAWKKMGDSETTYPRLGTAIKQTEPELEADGITIIFNVGNSAQQIWIEKNSLPRLTGFLQKELKNSELKLIIRVKEVEESEKKLYMPQEKAEFLLKNNPELVSLKKDLDLEIK